MAHDSRHKSQVSSLPLHTRVSRKNEYQETHKRTLLETLLVKAVAACVTKNDEGEILFVPARHRFIADWTIFAVNLTLFLWLGPLCTVDRLASGIFISRDYATVSK